MALTDLPDAGGKVAGAVVRQHDQTVLVPFTRPDHDLATVKVHIPDPQRAAFLDTQAGAVHPADHQTGHGAFRQRGDQPAHFAGTQDRGHPNASVSPQRLKPSEMVRHQLVRQYLSIEEHDGTQGLVPRRGADQLPYRQKSQKPLQIAPAKIPGMTPLPANTVESQISPDPGDIALDCGVGQVTAFGDLSQAFEQAHRRTYLLPNSIPT